ncbi:uncharacterized protein Z518_09456 [Rhinocladiella mackenziei CBS 650.93]|uniref:Uncharacterized protein n=1 Tax=Rhinocladiella mackenziei CBS 650.93 TaxID=1442369 RepID=A0A0D2IYM8_9EURO|nr:uncharacterized protein Z518_09456 [Rhinocladiella mackenziei CBS 650.93]KIX01730.1 hypothetical protein Z518_09456 [Rhinocladiella mackenziei CBS 650.93]
MPPMRVLNNETLKLELSSPISRKEELNPPITSQILDCCMVHGLESRDKLDDAPQDWKDELTNVEDDKDAAVFAKGTIEVVFKPDKLIFLHLSQPSKLNKLRLV